MKRPDNPNLLAQWDESRRQYVVETSESRDWTEWFSSDGDTWTTEAGHPVESDEFMNAQIQLVGGPRHGEVVS